MKRQRLFELEDLSFLPNSWRDYALDYLGFLHKVFATYENVSDKIHEALKSSGSHKILDLCSGSGRPALQLQNELLTKHKLATSVTLSDLYPPKIKNEIEAGWRYKKKSLDARKAKFDKDHFLTMYTAFHHFTDEEGLKIIQSATSTAPGIAILEVTERNLLSILKICLTSLTVFVFTPFVRPLRFSRLFWTYVLPVVPIIVTWDGIISNLRSYTLEELTALGNRCKKENRT